MTKRFRTMFLSDIHLGTRGCQADLLLAFLARHEAEKIYLVGDIFDGWRLRRGWHWPALSMKRSIRGCSGRELRRTL